MWDQRYAETEHAYGTAPNDFLASQADALASPVLELASGQGRNLVWIAEQGHEAHGVDASSVGVSRSLQLAEERGVSVVAVAEDLATFDLGEACWGSIVSIFAHLPPSLRPDVHARVVRALRPGGHLILEAYTPAQLAFKTGGPPVLPMLYTADMLRKDFAGLEFLRIEEFEREVHEGRYHHGRAAVVQVLARKPSR
ncbi:MAG: class I SAM-dependent methyltransferase [Deltaproteobacteria bacterium]|nr:MAG: class I SAM-dependent methyltransferase [Deltaproteobacteria bacterium]